MMIIFNYNKKLSSYLLIFFIFCILIQICIGGFVSGLDAGKIYQTWPLMDYTYFPSDVAINAVKDIFNFNNHGLIQFYHRNIAYLILFYILIIGFFIFKNNSRKLIRPFYFLFFFLILQIFLGILTLISGLNIYLASVHQICGLLLTLSVINLYYNYIN